MCLYFFVSLLEDSEQFLTQTKFLKLKCWLWRVKNTNKLFINCFLHFGSL